MDINIINTSQNGLKPHQYLPKLSQISHILTQTCLNFTKTRSNGPYLTNTWTNGPEPLPINCNTHFIAKNNIYRWCEYEKKFDHLIPDYGDIGVKRLLTSFLFIFYCQLIIYLMPKIFFPLFFFCFILLNFILFWFGKAKFSISIVKNSVICG